MIEIRNATARDIAELARVHVKADWDAYAPLFGAEAYMPDVGESERRWSQALGDGGTLLVATDAGAIVGLGHARADRIDALYLLAPYHRKGIGKAMLRRLLQALHARGVAEAKVDVVAINAQAIAFYIAQGARPVSRCVNRDLRGDSEDRIFVMATMPAHCRTRSSRDRITAAFYSRGPGLFLVGPCCPEDVCAVSFAHANSP